MLKLKILSIFSLLLLTNYSCCKPKEVKVPDTKKIKAPKAKKIEKKLTIHGHTRIDNYYWLKDKKNPEVIKYLKSENKYTAAIMKHTKPLQKKLYQEIIGRIKQKDKSVPYKLNGYYYYKRNEESKEYPIYCRRKKSMKNAEEIMLNVNEMAKEHSYYNVKGLKVSQDNTILAFGVDTVSRRKYTIHFKNLVTGKMYKDQVINTPAEIAWANDNKSIFYTVKDKALRSYKIKKHVLGESVSKDKEIFHEKDDTFGTYVYKTKSGKFIVIGSYSTLSTEYRVLDAATPNGKFKIIQPRERNLEYSVDHYKDKFYILTNYKAKNFKLVETPVNKTKKENWKDIIPHRKDVFLENIEIFKNHLVVEERKNGLIGLRIIKWADKKDYYVDFGEPTYLAYISINYEFNTNLLRFGYTSLTTPSSIFHINMNTKKKTLLKQQEIVGDFKSKNYISERLYATAKDGTKVPISLVYKKNWKKDTPAPLLIEGYGSYGYSSDAYFSSVRLSLLDRGFIYAIAHIRGGQEMGRQWYEDGKLLKKKNTFTDFIACSQHLIDKKYTSSKLLFANGGSAGGLLMGAVSNMKPGIYKGIIADVPFVDVVTTMLDDSIPLTTGEYDEWGNPNKKKYYQYMLSYSPYDNVEAKKYPAMLVTTGLHDSQVQYWEPAKWVAKLRELKKDKNILLLKTDMSSGHGGASGRFKIHKLTAFTYAFMLDLIGVKK